MSNTLEADARLLIEQYPEWYHSIELAPGVATPGRAPLAFWNEELRALQLPPLSGKSVLDVGAYDGFFSFAAERLGAARVVALDHYAWSADMTNYMREWRQSLAEGRTLPSPHQTTHWRPSELPGKAPFDAARQLLKSRVESITSDFMSTSAEMAGTFDVVLFLGVLYHVQDPFGAIRKMRELTAPGGMCIVETEAMEIPGTGSRALCEFFPTDELNHDASNWWAPNEAALVAFCRAAGFSSVRTLPERQPLSPLRRAGKLVKRAASGLPFTPVLRRYRLIVQASV